MTRSRMMPPRTTLWLRIDPNVGAKRQFVETSRLTRTPEQTYSSLRTPDHEVNRYKKTTKTPPPAREPGRRTLDGTKSPRPTPGAARRTLRSAPHRREGRHALAV